MNESSSKYEKMESCQHIEGKDMGWSYNGFGTEKCLIIMGLKETPFQSSESIDEEVF